MSQLPSLRLLNICQSIFFGPDCLCRLLLSIPQVVQQIIYLLLEVFVRSIEIFDLGVGIDTSEQPPIMASVQIQQVKLCLCLDGPLRGFLICFFRTLGQLFVVIEKFLP